MEGKEKFLLRPQGEKESFLKPEVMDFSEMDPEALARAIDEKFKDAAPRFENAEFNNIFVLAKEMIQDDPEVQQYVFTQADQNIVDKIIEREIAVSKNNGIHQIQIEKLMGNKEKTEEYIENASKNLY